MSTSRVGTRPTSGVYEQRGAVAFLLFLSSKPSVKPNSARQTGAHALSHLDSPAVTRLGLAERPRGGDASPGPFDEPGASILAESVNSLSLCKLNLRPKNPEGSNLRTRRPAYHCTTRTEAARRI